MRHTMVVGDEKGLSNSILPNNFMSSFTSVDNL